MNWFWMNVPAALAFVGLWSGISLWLVLKRPDRGPQSLAVQAAGPDRPGCARRAADRAGPAAQRAAGGRVTAIGEAW
jgi:hypothetical protein